jgi:hypothetical protein
MRSLLPWSKKEEEISQNIALGTSSNRRETIIPDMKCIPHLNTLWNKPSSSFTW